MARFGRRKGVLGLAAAAGAYAWKRHGWARSGGHDAYFSALNQRLKAQDIGHPVVVVDAQAAERNARRIVDVLRQSTKPLALRLVVKSLPSWPLLQRLSEWTGSRKYMVFNASMLEALWQEEPEADIVLGKPLPVAELRALLRRSPALFSRAVNTQWLVDSLARMSEYQACAQEAGLNFAVSLELDVGLHRGGFSTPEEVAAASRLIQASPNLSLRGLMGYEAHVGKTPALLGMQASAHRLAVSKIAAAVSAVEAQGFKKEALTVNSGGSLTYMFHAEHTAANDISVGSAVVLPSDFSVPQLSGLEPAAFLATPVLKRLRGASIPGLEFLDGARRWLLPQTQQAVFIAGGNWMARPASPAGLATSGLYGRSSNQELLMASDDLILAEGDFVFLRPTQSEAVLNQFGSLLWRDQDRLETWPVWA